MIKAHLAHLKYTLRHKWFVLYAGMTKTKAPFLRLLLHDASKFSREEWGPYVRQFFNPDGTRKSVRRKDGGYDPNEQPVEFKKAWLHHQKNKHHWQAWVSIGEGGSLEPLPMPESYIREMVADWMGAGKALTGKWDISVWYAANGNKILLDKETRKKVDEIINSLMIRES